jgi:twitching motility protein PilT
VLSQALCPRVDTDGMVAAYEFMYVTPSIQNLIRENKVFRIDSEIQTGKRFGMQLLDDTLWDLFHAGKISKEEAIDKSKVPGQMMEKFTRMGLDGGLGDELPEGEGGGGDASGTPAKPKPPAGGGGGSTTSDAERRAQMEANRARMAAMAAKK